MAEGARLESVYTLIAYRGFESLRLRQILANFFSNYPKISFVRHGYKEEHFKSMHL